MSNLEDEKMSLAQVGIGTGVLLVVVVLFCFIVWQVTHKDGKENVIVTKNTETEQDVVSGLPLASDSEGESQVAEGTGETGGEVLASNTDSELDSMSFTSVKELVTAKDVTNLRSEPSTSQGKATVVAQLNNGDYATRVGINDATGWSKLEYNGKTVYAVSQYLILKQDENAGREDE